MFNRLPRLARFFCALVTALTALADPASSGAAGFETPLTQGALDPAAFAQWVDGTETPVAEAKEGPTAAVWTKESKPEWNGVRFGPSATTGPRHLRIGWRGALPVGSVLTRAVGLVSALKTGAPYPGRLDNEQDWVPAQRLEKGQLSNRAATEDTYALWVFPPGTSTRALRFTHVPEATDKEYAGWLGGAYVLSERLANLSAVAAVFTTANSGGAGKIINESSDRTWDAWDNAPGPNAAHVSVERPVDVIITWPSEVKVRGLGALWAGFAQAEVQTYAGPPDRHAREASANDWKTIRQFQGLQHHYPLALPIHWLDFGNELGTRALRLRITQPINEAGIHEHLRGSSRGGRRVWLGELIALQTLHGAELASIHAKTTAPEVQPPIPVRFHLPEDGLVTLVIEDEQGRRVRNLIAETKFPAGPNIAWWDGTDDLLRDAEAARHGVYHIPRQFVRPGSYRVRGLWHKQIDLRYEFSLYNAGQPAWETASGTGAWLANHTPPAAALFVPGKKGVHGSNDLVYLGSFVSEGGHGLAWVDLEGRKRGGVGWVGGNWTGAAFLARDDGPEALTNIAAYAAAPWSVETYLDRATDKRGEIRITAITRQGMKAVTKQVFTPAFEGAPTQPKDVDWFSQMGGLAAHNGVIAFSLTRRNEIVFIRGRDGSRMGAIDVPAPRGLAFDKQGRLLVISRRQLLRLGTADDALSRRGAEPGAAALISSDLEEPCQVTVDGAGQFYISDHGHSHQVKIFTAEGKLVRAIGKPGAPRAGVYDPEHMNHPLGMTVDAQQRLWVAENDLQPKRVSVWSAEGKLLRAYYGPSEYGGGGRLDPQDPTKFYYHGMEFRLDWEKGTDQLASVFHRQTESDLRLPGGYFGPPENPHYVRGRRYWSNDHNSNPTGGAGIAMIWIDADGIARPVAALGRANDWNLLKGDAFKRLWPSGVDLKGDPWHNMAWFAWSDLNGDAKVQPDELKMRKGTLGSVTVAADLSFAASRIGDKAMRFAPASFTKAGAPVYDLAAGQVLATEAQGPTSSGGDQALWHPGGWTVLTTPPRPFSPLSVGAVFKGEPSWSYPSPWPGLHASHESPAPEMPGQIIGTTRLLGPFIVPPGSDAGPVWAINGNQGNIYLFTADGLFVSELFRDVRRGPTWSMPRAERGMLLNGLTLKDENFWPSITQTKDGRIFVCDGARSSLVRVDGLETIRRFPESRLTISATDLAAARAYFVEAEARRQANTGRDLARVMLRRTPPVVDGTLKDWAGAEWVDIDKSGVAAYFDSKSKPYDVKGALVISGDRLYVAYQTGNPDLLRNSGESRNALFKTGGALDLMIGVNSNADETRAKPETGDLRVLATLVRGRPVAMLYRAVVPGTREPVPFSSPWRTITLDRVDDISDDIKLAGKDGNYELSIPLSVLGLRPQRGLKLKGDVGILRGNGFQTVQRVYWSNKASGITADVPSEAELTPRLWGRLELTADE